MKNIVIIGGGFGGIQTARHVSSMLKKFPPAQTDADAWQIILIDKNTYHTFTPALYEIATAYNSSERPEEMDDSQVDRKQDSLLFDELLGGLVAFPLLKNNKHPNKLFH